MTLITICKIMRKGTQRGTTCVHGRSQAAWLVKLENDVPAKPQSESLKRMLGRAKRRG